MRTTLYSQQVLRTTIFQCRLSLEERARDIGIKLYCTSANTGWSNFCCLILGATPRDKNLTVHDMMVCWIFIG